VFDGVEDNNDEDPHTGDDCSQGLKSGTDYDNDGCKDAEDADDDGDSILDADDDCLASPASSPSYICEDNGYTCYDPANDYDGDGCLSTNEEDPDDDNDGALDDDDNDDANEFICSDNDGDGCDDCSSGKFDTSDDGDMDPNVLCGYIVQWEDSGRLHLNNQRGSQNLPIEQYIHTEH
jgi:hypothetical protein